MTTRNFRAFRSYSFPRVMMSDRPFRTGSNTWTGYNARNGENGLTTRSISTIASFWRTPTASAQDRLRHSCIVTGTLSYGRVKLMGSDRMSNVAFGAFKRKMGFRFARVSATMREMMVWENKVTPEIPGRPKRKQYKWATAPRWRHSTRRDVDVGLCNRRPTDDQVSERALYRYSIFDKVNKYT